MIAAYIANIVPGGLEADVDHLWTNLLAYYFPVPEKYGVEREAYIRSRSMTKANVSVSTITNGSMYKVIMVENKRASTSRAGTPPPSSWAHAENQLLGYMLSRRQNQMTPLASLFGIVGIGRFVKFFKLRRGKTQLEDDYSGSILHLETDHLAIEQQILLMKNYIARRR